MQRIARALAGPAVALLLFACGNDAEEEERFSDHFSIGELNGSFGAFADEGTLKVFAAVLGPKGFLRLRGGDTIEIDVDGARVPARERLLDSKVHYIAEVPPPASETEVKITFVRGLERVVGTIRLPPAFAVTAPPSSVRFGQSVPIDVDPRPDLSRWQGPFGPTLTGKAQVVGDCLETGAQQIPLCAGDSPAGQCQQRYPLQLDTKRLVLKAGASGCEVNVEVRLTTNGAPYQGTGPEKQVFKGGGFDGHRLRNMKLQLAP